MKDYYQEPPPPPPDPPPDDPPPEELPPLESLDGLDDITLCAEVIVLFINVPKVTTLNPVGLSYQDGACNDIDLDLVSKRLKEIRKSLKMTMRELAERLNTSSSAISNYENSKFLILSSLLIQLCKMCNYSIDYVLGRTNKKSMNQ